LKAILEQIETVEYLATETALLTCKHKLLQEIESHRSHDPRLWKIFMLLVNLPQQPRHVTEPEKAFMKELRRRFHFSISELGFIFNRSSETVSRQLESGGERSF